MSLAFTIARANPRSADTVGVGVFTEGPVPRGLGANRSALGALGFEGKVGQTARVPAPNGALAIAVGLGDRSQVSAAVLRVAAAALSRAAAKRT